MSIHPGRQARLNAFRYRPEEIAARVGGIRRAVLSTSKHINVGNFAAIGRDDLETLYVLYDSAFFNGLLADWLAEDRAGTLGFRVSSRMTRAGGKTIRTRARPTRKAPAPPAEYEIAVSSTLLFQTFGDVARPVEVVGLACRDRLDALQRIFEHELIHLAEFLALGTSSCSAEPFQAVARSMFGHLKAVHDLVTPRELAATTHDLGVGHLVSFDHDGLRRIGRINRITRRATVLVESPNGRLFTDGRRYETYYVPLEMLRKVE
ncbi:SprT-like family protein [Tundrisphaera sp. TA3]|uniref:SprT-like family protein n=1 Tax=Tundrisphaera sp. TA3 TaxID=3435775 RepID=UPI003EBD0506